MQRTFCVLIATGFVSRGMIPLLLTAIHFLAYAGVASAQNLVPNPSFELLSSCPTTYSQLGNADFWFQPSEGTSDYFHACAPAGELSTPLSALGNEPPRTGAAYGGIIPAEFFVPYHEYATSPLSEPLTAGVVYDVSFYVSLADGSGRAIEELGAYLSVDSGYGNTFAPQVLPAQIVNTNGTLDQVDGWTLISGSFEATGGERFITIGSFVASPTLTTVTPTMPAPELSDVAYYFIDDVTVEVANICQAVIDFEILEHDDALETLSAIVYSEDGYSVWITLGAEIYTYGKQHPSYTPEGGTAIHSQLEMTLIDADGNPISGGSPFNLVSMDLAEDNASTPPGATVTMTGTKSVAAGGGVVQEVFPLDGDGLLGAERYEFIDFADVVKVVISPPHQIDNICIGETGCACFVPVISSPTAGSFCVDGDSDGVGWSWRLTSTVDRSVFGVLPVGAPSRDIVQAFAVDMMLAGLTVYTSTATPHCLDVVMPAADSLFVGSFGFAANCEVTGNAVGCTFNPTITDATFLPPFPGDDTPTPLPAAAVVPSLGVHGGFVLLVLLVSFATASAALLRSRASD